MSSILIANPNPQLTFGSQNLFMDSAAYAAVGYRYTAQGTDTKWGNPVQITEAVTSWLRQGSIVALQGYDNREMYVRIKIEAADSGALARAEAPLFGETGKPNRLIWTPPDGAGEPCVFLVVMSELEHLFDETAELRITRYWGLKITARPFVRAVDLTAVTFPEPTGTQTFTQIDSCDTTTGWSTETSAVVGGVPVGAVTAGTTFDAGTSVGSVVEDQAVGSTFMVRSKKSGLTENMSTQKYLRVSLASNIILGNPWFVNSEWAGTPAFVFRLDGQIVAPIAKAGYVYWFDAAAAGITTLHTVSVEIQALCTGPNSVTAIYVDDLTKSNLPGTQPTTKQIHRTFPIAGSAPTDANLQISTSDAGGIGDLLLHTMPAVPGAASPNLMQFLASGNARTTDSTLVSGAYSDLASLHRFEIPIGQVVPGAHTFMARIYCPTAGDFDLTWGVRERRGDGTLSLLFGAEGVTTVDGGAGAEYILVEVELLNLPMTKMGPNGKVVINLTGEAGMRIDEAWIFYAEDGAALTQGYAFARKRFFVDAPTLENPSPGYYSGSLADRSDTLFAGGSESLDLHDFTAGLMSVYVVTTDAPTSALEVSYYRTAHSHIAALDA